MSAHSVRADSPPTSAPVSDDTLEAAILNPVESALQGNSHLSQIKAGKGRPSKALTLRRDGASGSTPVTELWERQKRKREVDTSKESVEITQKKGKPAGECSRRMPHGSDRDKGAEMKSVSESGSHLDLLMDEVRRMNADTKNNFEQFKREILQAKSETNEELKKIREELTRKEQEWRSNWQNTVKRLDNLEQKVNSQPLGIQKIEEQIKKVDEKMNQASGGFLNGEVSAKLAKLDQLVEAQDRLERKDNIIIKGLAFQPKKHAEAVEHLLDSSFGLKDKCISVKVVGKANWLVATLDGPQSKAMILKMKRQALAGTDIYIEEDLSPVDREIAKKIRVIARAESEAGRLVKRTRQKLQKLQIDGVWWIWDKTKNGLVKAPETKNRSATKNGRVHGGDKGERERGAVAPSTSVTEMDTETQVLPTQM